MQLNTVALKPTTAVEVSSSEAPHSLKRVEATQPGIRIQNHLAQKHRAQKYPSQKQRDPKFGNLFLTGVSKVVGLVDSSRIMELIALDWGGFIIPRVAIEYKQRNADAAREAAIREIAAHVTYFFLAGWLAIGTLPFFGPKLAKLFPKLNPQGIHHKSWVHGNALETFSNRFLEEVKPGHSPEQIRNTFINRTLKDLQSTDAHQYQKFMAYLRQRPGGNIAFDALQTEGALQKEAGFAELRKLFDYAEKSSEGSVNLSKQAQTIIEKAKAGDAKAMAKWTEAKKSPELLRLMLSGEANTSARKALFAKMNEAGLKAGLTDGIELAKVGVGQDGKLVLGREPMLKKLLYFLEQFGDRALADVPEALKRGETLTDDGVKAVFKAFENQPTQWSRIWESVLPKASDNLITAAKKVKFFSATIPIVLTCFAGMTVAYVNKMITAKKHHNMVYFPGEGTAEEVAQLRQGMVNPNMSVIPGSPQRGASPSVTSQTPVHPSNLSARPFQQFTPETTAAAWGGVA